ATGVPEVSRRILDFDRGVRCLLLPIFNRRYLTSDVLRWEAYQTQEKDWPPWTGPVFLGAHSQTALIFRIAAHLLLYTGLSPLDRRARKRNSGSSQITLTCADSSRAATSDQCPTLALRRGPSPAAPFHPSSQPCLPRQIQAALSRSAACYPVRQH